MINLTAFFIPLLAGGGGVHPAISKAVNLAIFLGFLYYVLRKPIRQFFNERLASVRATLAQAAKEKDAATAKMAELDARLNRLDAELAGISAQAKREAEAERRRLQEETNRNIEKLKLSTQREIESSKLAAIADLREFAATKAVDLAEQMIRREITPDDDAQLVKRVGEELGKSK